MLRARFGKPCIVVAAWVLATVFTTAAQARVGTITQFSAPAFTRGIAIAPDGALWFTDSNEVVRRALDGTLTRYPVSKNPRLATLGLTPGPRDSMWFAAVAQRAGGLIGRITRTGEVKRYRLPAPDPGPFNLTEGPDGNIWFTEYAGNAIGRLTPTGTLTEFPVPTMNSRPWGIVSGPDGNLWFTEFFGGAVGRITTSGVVTEFPTSGGSSANITVGPDGALWFTEPAGNKLGRIATSGALTEFHIPSPRSDPIGIAAGADGEIWFTEHGEQEMGRFSLERVFHQYRLVGNPGPWSMVAGSDGNLWFTETNVSQIGRITDRPAATLAIDPSEGPPGTSVVVTGSAFGSYERVRVMFEDQSGPPVELVHVTADAQGRFSATVSIPAGAGIGNQSALGARGVVSGIRRFLAFTVTEPSGGLAG